MPSPVRIAGRRVALLVGVAAALAAADGQLTVQLIDGLPRPLQPRCGTPTAIAVPVVGGVGGAGVAVSAQAGLVPYAVDGSGLRLRDGRLEGGLTVTIPAAAGGAPSQVRFALAGRIDGDAVSGTATATRDAGKRGSPPTEAASPILGFWDERPAAGWLVECAIPWIGTTDRGSSHDAGTSDPLAADSLLVALRFPAAGAAVVHAAFRCTDSTAVALPATGSVEGDPARFTARVELRPEGAAPIAMTLAGGRLGRLGLVQVQAKAGATSFAGGATVLAWPDLPGLRGMLPSPAPSAAGLSAEPDPALVAAAAAEARRAIFARPPGDQVVWPGHGPVWAMTCLARGDARAIAPLVFDIKTVDPAGPVAGVVVRTTGKIGELARFSAKDPWEAIDQAWTSVDLGFMRITLTPADGRAWVQHHLFNALRGRRDGKGPVPGWLMPLARAPRYQVEIAGKTARVAHEVADPADPLTPVWDKLPPGDYTVTITSPAGGRPWSARFERRASFQGPYRAGPARPFAAFSLDLARWLCDAPIAATQRGLCAITASGGGDFGTYNYIVGAAEAGVVRWRLATDVEERRRALWVARNAGGCLRTIMRNTGYPKVYKQHRTDAVFYGMAFLELHAATGEAIWAEAAAEVAAYLAASQQPSGNWLMIDPPLTAKVPAQQRIVDAGLNPGIHGAEMVEMDASPVLWFLGRLRTQLRTDRFAANEEKAYQWVMAGPVVSGIWLDQGHHSTVTVAPLKLTSRGPAYFALYLLDSAAPERRDPALIGELLRFGESRHVDWRRDGAGTRIQPNLDNAVNRESGGPAWQAARLVEGWIKLHRLTGDPLAAAKAKALADAITWAQDPVSGALDTDLAPSGGRIDAAYERFQLNYTQTMLHLLRYAEVAKVP